MSLAFQMHCLPVTNWDDACRKPAAELRATFLGRYDMVDGHWVYKHDGHVFQERLARELQEITGKEKVDLDQEPQVAQGFVGYGADPT